MAGPWFTTPWQLVSQSHGAVAWCFRPPCPSHVPFPFASSRHRPVPSVPWTPYPIRPLCGPSHTPFPAPSPCHFLPCFYPTSSPATLWRWPTWASSFVGPLRALSTGPFPPPSLPPVPRPNPLGCLAAPSHPSSRVYTPPGRPLDPHPSGDRFVHLATVTPFQAPSPVPRPRPIPLGCRAAPSHPSSRVYTPSGRQQPCGAGPLDPHPSGDRFVRSARVAPLPPPPLCPVLSPLLS